MELTDQEIRLWFNEERIRLGKYFERFEIAWWEKNEYEVNLLLQSVSSCKDIPFSEDTSGRIIEIQEIHHNNEDDYMPILNKLARNFYYKWKKEVPELKRNMRAMCA